MPDAPGETQCRICLEDAPADALIAPCLCSGTSRFVHRACLDEWRAVESVPRAFTHCPTCRFQYLTVLAEPMSARASWRALWSFRLLVARDMGLYLVAVQLAIAALARLIHVCDRRGRVVALFPPEWAAANRSALSLGPYFISGVVVFFALLGVGAMVHECCAHSRRTNDDVNGGLVACLCCDETGCRACAGCSRECGACGDCAGPALPAAAAIGLGLLLLMALLGLVASLFVGALVLQRAAERHAHLVGRRREARALVVRDLRHEPELLRSLSDRPVTTAPLPPAGTAPLPHPVADVALADGRPACQPQHNAPLLMSREDDV
jgi:hypothetical protein